MTTPTMPEAQQTSTSITLTPSQLQLQLDPLSYERYWRFGLQHSKLNYRFCRKMGTASLKTSEFVNVKNSFPIVFFSQDSDLPHAILGLAPNINLSITHKDEWRRGLYIPKIFQRYPFGLVELDSNTENAFIDSLPLLGETGMESHKKSLLAIDLNTSMLVPLQEEPYATQLFQQDGSITPYVKQEVIRQTEMRQEQIDTASFVSAMRANKLFMEKSINLHFKDGSLLTVEGFSIINRAEFSKISPTTLERWAEQGYLELIEDHWQSQKMWARLINLHERRLKRALSALRLKKKR